MFFKLLKRQAAYVLITFPLAPPNLFEGVNMRGLRYKANHEVAKLFVLAFTKGFAVWAWFKYPASAQNSSVVAGIDGRLSSSRT